jgi:hypothetical protein
MAENIESASVQLPDDLRARRGECRVGMTRSLTGSRFEDDVEAQPPQLSHGLRRGCYSPLSGSRLPSYPDLHAPSCHRATMQRYKL